MKQIAFDDLNRAEELKNQTGRTLYRTRHIVYCEAHSQVFLQAETRASQPRVQYILSRQLGLIQRIGIL